MKHQVTERQLENRKLIGQRIAEIRKSRHITQRTLGDMTNIPFSHLAAIERGYYSVGLDSLTNICDALGVKVLLDNERDIKVFEG